MTQHRTPTRTAPHRTAPTLRAALRSAVLLIAAVTSVGLLPAVAAATPPPPDPATPSSITPTSAGWRAASGRPSQAQAGPKSALTDLGRRDPRAAQPGQQCQAHLQAAGQVAAETAVQQPAGSRSTLTSWPASGEPVHARSREVTLR
jgi:hypothetical protein